MSDETTAELEAPKTKRKAPAKKAAVKKVATKAKAEPDFKFASRWSLFVELMLDNLPIDWIMISINFNLFKTMTFFKLSKNLLNIPNFRINMGHFIAKDSYIPTM